VRRLRPAPDICQNYVEGRKAKEIARRADSWITLSNAFSDQQGGLIARYFPDAEQRPAFLCSAEHEELNQLLLRTIKGKGLYPHNSSGNGARK
jgi:hypothetical protein